MGLKSRKQGVDTQDIRYKAVMGTKATLGTNEIYFGFFRVPGWNLLIDAIQRWVVFIMLQKGLQQHLVQYRSTIESLLETTRV